MIRTQSLHKVYDGVPALQGVDLAIPRGELCVLLGPSGCGKSTLLKLLNALITPTSGDIFIDGRNIRQVPPEQLRRGIGYVVQSVGLFPHYTVAQNIGVVPTLLHWPQARILQRSEELLSLIGLPQSTLRKYPHELSGGEAQRVGVARALAADPPLLLMDEPFGSVDPLNRERLQQAFLGIQRALQKTVVFVTHDVQEALALADRILLMRDGRIVRSGTPRQMVTDPGDAFSRAFFGSDMALKMLGRSSVSDVAQPGEADPAHAIEAGAPLSEALSRMLLSGVTRLQVVREGQPVGVLTLDGLLQFYREGRRDEN